MTINEFFEEIYVSQQQQRLTDLFMENFDMFCIHFFNDNAQEIDSINDVARQAIRYEQKEVFNSYLEMILKEKGVDGNESIQNLIKKK